MPSYLCDTLDLAKAVVVGCAGWVTACGTDPPADHVVTGMAGRLYEGDMLTDGGTKTLALPLAMLAFDDGVAWERSGHRRWQRQGGILLDVAVTGAATPAAYRATVQLAEDLLVAFQTAHDAGTFLCGELSMPGAPVRYPPEAPGLLRGAWAFRLSIGWTTGRPPS